MILEPTAGYDFGEQEVKFVNVLARKSDGNKLLAIADLNAIKREMQKEGIPADNLKQLCKKMEDNGILQYHDEGGQTWITLNSEQVVRFQSHLKNVCCPECHKLPLKRKKVAFCPCCGYEQDED